MFVNGVTVDLPTIPVAAVDAMLSASAVVIADPPAFGAEERDGAREV